MHHVEVRGEIGSGPFVFTRHEIVPGRLAPMSVSMFDGVRATEAEFDLTEVHLTVQDSTFDRCRFSQRRKKAADGSWGQGSLARRATTYRDCEFVGVRFRSRAGFSVGNATFERCSFKQCDFGEHFSFCADYVDCVFDGPIRVAVFYGTAPGGHGCDSKVNTIRGNDFSGAVLGDVAFRGHADVAAQRWPAELDLTTVVDDL